MDFTYPRDLKAELLKRYPDYTHEKKWERRVMGGDKLFRENLDYISSSFQRGVELARFCGDKYGWDVMMVLYKFVDNLQHKVWKYIDPDTAHLYPRRNELVKQCFANLDVAIGQLMDLADEKDASIMVMSDHGHGSLLGKAQPNLLLSEWGYLKLGANSSRFGVRAKGMLSRLIGKKYAFANESGQNVDRELAVDWSQTRACVMHAGIYGFCYLNVKGRQPTGIVDPAEYEAVRDEIRERFLAARTTDRKGRQIPIFTEVHKPEQLYDCDRTENSRMPDLLLVPYNGLAVVRKIRGTQPVRWLPLRRIEGTHRLEGIYAAFGPGFRTGETIHANIADLAPTLLAGLGLPVPQDMEGRVLQETFVDRVTVEYEPPEERDVTDDERIRLTEAQEAEVADRLSDLGYLE
jgi:predicted AlkP superfamily phosphohydrolase/phosphomutase